MVRLISYHIEEVPEHANVLEGDAYGHLAYALEGMPEMVSTLPRIFKPRPRLRLQRSQHFEGRGEVNGTK